MINIDEANNEFICYTNNFDNDNDNISRKIGHSYRVENNCEIIAKNLYMSIEQIQLAKLIGILHDIGRFEQYKEYKTFSDRNSINHAKLGVEILKENNYLRKFIEMKNYDNIIYKAIENHNKIKITEELNKEELLFAKIIRDADKLDILFEEIEIFAKYKYHGVFNEKISDKVLEEAKGEQVIDNKYVETYLDKIVQLVMFVYDLNFKISFEILEEKNYINKILDLYNYNEKAKMQIEEIKKMANIYISNKIK